MFRRGVHGQQFRSDLYQLDAAALGRVVADDAAGIHVLARGEHATLKGDGCEYCGGQRANHDEGLHKEVNAKPPRRGGVELA
ncbi:hypothetical protein D3C80_1782190 [compost metagenome]